ncbi:hypothetical protein Mapa_008386 [Marchantia paleacea]|nr:hypothetical protein Mapa_008386 [Marchantia paleacea]
MSPCEEIICKTHNTQKLLHCESDVQTWLWFSTLIKWQTSRFHERRNLYQFDFINI